MTNYQTKYLNVRYVFHMKSIAYLTIITNIIKCENMIAKSMKVSF